MAPSNKSLKAGQVQLEKNSTLFLLSSFGTAVRDRALRSEATRLFLQTFTLVSGKQLLDAKRVMHQAPSSWLTHKHQKHLTRPIRKQQHLIAQTELNAYTRTCPKY